MTITLVDLFVNAAPSLNTDTWCITYNRTGNVVYQIGLPGAGPAVISTTSHNGTTGLVTNTHVFSTSMPISGNTLTAGGLLKGFCTSPSGTEYYVATRGTLPNTISKFDGSTLLETAYLQLASVSATSVFPLQTFTLGGTDYLAVAYNTSSGTVGAIQFINAGTMANVLKSTFSISAYNEQFFYLIKGEQPSDHEQAFYIVGSAFFGSDGAVITVRKIVFDSNTVAVTTNTRFTYKSTVFDPTWTTSFTNGALPELPMFDPTDNTIIILASRTGAFSGLTTDGYLLKLSTTAASVVWKLAVPGNQFHSNTSANSDLSTGTLKYMPGPSNRGYTYPWAEPDTTDGPLLIINQVDGTYTIERYAQFGRTETINSQRPPIYSSVDNKLFFYDVDGVNSGHGGWWGVLYVALIPHRGLTFSEFRDTTYHDWVTAGEGVGANFASHLYTYYHAAEDPMLWMQSPYVYVYLENSDVWDDTKSLIMTGAFDWGLSTDSHKWSTPQQVYQFRGTNLVSITRRKVRGKGRVLQLRFDSDEGKDFNLFGWGIWLDKRTRP